MSRRHAHSPTGLCDVPSEEEGGSRRPSHTRTRSLHGHRQAVSMLSPSDTDSKSGDGDVELLDWNPSVQHIPLPVPDIATAHEARSSIQLQDMYETPHADFDVRGLPRPEHGQQRDDPAIVKTVAAAIHNPDILKSILSQLPGVDVNDRRFLKFFA
jgi:hypothetical protein